MLFEIEESLNCMVEICNDDKAINEVGVLKDQVSYPQGGVFVLETIVRVLTLTILFGCTKVYLCKGQSNI